MKRDKNISQQKSFYFALYSAVIGLAVLASAVTYSNLHSISDKQLKTAKNSEENLVKPVLNNQTKSYLVPEDRKENKNQENKKSIAKTNKNISSFTYSKINNPSQNLSEAKKVALNQSPDKKTDQNIQQKEHENKNLEQNKIDNTNKTDQSIKPENHKNTQEENTTEIKDLENPNDTNGSFDSFSENQKMSWPVFGEIVMDYDNENLVYDKTLEQYRTNDCISLSAQVGEQVKATADGIVKSVINTPESGNTIILDHGNGWSTTYSQLQDDLLVEQGDIVKKGQVIGGVGSPTKYGILLGSHLDFKVSHDDNYIDPKSIMIEK